MSILTSITGAVTGGDGNILEQVKSLITGYGGGISGFVDKLKSGGLSDKVSSWMGNGSMQSVSGSELTKALGSTKIKEFGDKVGLPADKAADQLASVLPNVISSLSPDGKSPLEGVTGAVGSTLSGLVK